MDKKELRKIVKNQMSELSPEYCDRASRSIAEQIFANDEFIKANTIFAFISMPCEPQMKEIIERAWSLGKRVCIPHCNQKPEMFAKRLSTWQELVPGAYGIPEASEGCELVAAEEIDLALVPCMAASKEGKRLGHGAGYYDYYLKNQRAFKLCVCFEKLLREDIPMDSNDIYMDLVVYDRL